METIPLEDLLGNKPSRVWDYPVPVVKTSTGYKIYLADQIGSPDFYNELCYTIEEAQPHEVIYIYLNTPGGSADAAFAISDSIKRSPARVIARLSGTVASAGTIITMACDDIEVGEGLTFMIHNYSASYSGKAHELKQLQKFAEEELTNHFRTVYQGFLTEDELDSVVDGNDHYMGSVDVRQRWANYLASLEHTIDE